MNLIIPRENEWEGGVLATREANYKNRMTYLYCKVGSLLRVNSRFFLLGLYIDYLEEGIP